MQPSEATARWRVLWLSTVAFTLMFNVWLMLGVLGIPIRNSLGLSDAQLEWLIAAAILSGSLLRLHFGIWTDRYGGRNMMMLLLVISALASYAFSQATTFEALLVCTLLVGLAGNSFAVGIAWNSAWFPPVQNGAALGIFGAGNVGAAGTKMLVVFVPGMLTLIPAAGFLSGVIPGGWRFIPALYCLLLIAMAVLMLLAPLPDRKPGRGRSMSAMLAPLRQPRVWRFSLYYVIVFGAYVALSGWLPKYYIDTYGLSLPAAALLTATFIFPASLLRPLGGYLSDRVGPRAVTYAVFITLTVCFIFLSAPSVAGLQIGPGLFAVLLFVVGCGMGIGKASVYKYIPNYFPDDVGAVGGLVGLLGALGGFVLPPLFGLLGRLSGAPQMAFVVLLLLTLCSLLWLHIVVVRMRAAARIEPQMVGQA